MRSVEYINVSSREAPENRERNVNIASAHGVKISAGKSYSLQLDDFEIDTPYNTGETAFPLDFSEFVYTYIVIRSTFEDTNLIVRPKHTYSKFGNPVHGAPTAPGYSYRWKVKESLRKLSEWTEVSGNRSTIEIVNNSGKEQEYDLHVFGVR